MKRFIIMIMMLSLFLIYSEDTSNFKITKNWIDVKKDQILLQEKRVAGT